MESYRQWVANAYNKHVRVKTFNVGDLDLQKVFQKTMGMTAGKFADTWEGPYLVDVIVEPGAYQLLALDGIQIHTLTSNKETLRMIWGDFIN